MRDIRPVCCLNEISDFEIMTYRMLAVDCKQYILNFIKLDLTKCLTVLTLNRTEYSMIIVNSIHLQLKIKSF